ncbi:hypothetical protein WN55_04387 [Dufourea novaeangliae]|uniref:Uncharacterized protein n=1 Tax=Dufourea novaeangliae TaxID=178035 RepID=A0A154PNS1_DUFNO|nr:hypothetical protein WN55_04387 [Dufourea novaeangliae]
MHTVLCVTGKSISRRKPRNPFLRSICVVKRRPSAALDEGKGRTPVVSRIREFRGHHFKKTAPKAKVLGPLSFGTNRGALLETL